MSHEGQLSANMQVDDEASVNWGASLGEGSAQGNVAGQSQSRPDLIDLTDLLSKGRSASYSPKPRGRTKSPNTVFRRGGSPTPRQKALGAHIAEVTEKLKRDFDAATSQRKQVWRMLQLLQNLGSQFPKLHSNRRSRGRRK